MKRFILDFILVCILVVIGSSFEGKNIDEEIKEYEQNFNPVIVEYDSHANKATLFAKKSGETIEEVVSIGVELITTIFKAIVE